MTLTNGRTGGGLPGNSRLTVGLAACGIKLAEKRKLETIGSKPIDILAY
jgi:hypothetical protein